MHDIGRATYLSATDDEWRWKPSNFWPGWKASFPRWNPRTPWPRVADVAREVGKDGIVVLNLSGRGDKDLATVAARMGKAGMADG